MDYKAFIFRQMPDSPIQASFVASSADIDMWAKAPTKMAASPRGFQRPVIRKHAQEIAKFFNDSTHQNSSPTALVLGVEPSGLPRIKTLALDQDRELAPREIGQIPILGRVRVEFDPWDSSAYREIDGEIAALFEQVKNLYENLPPAPEVEPGEDEDEDTGDETNGDNQTDEDDDDEELAEPSDDDHDFFATVSAAQLRDYCVRQAYRNWPLGRKKALRNILKDDRKPALIIDGQHRITGTAGIGTIPFMVSLLPGASWSELAFQFIVNNGSAKKVDEGLLIAIVGNSLSPEELAATSARLYRSGIQVSLIQAVMRVQKDPNPFQGMLKFNVPGEDGFLEAPAMQKKVVRLWYGSRGRTGDRPKFTAVKVDKHAKWTLDTFFGGVCSGESDSERARDWQDRIWFKYFSAFWSAVAEHFTGRLWPSNPQSWPSVLTSEHEREERIRLMRVTVLGLLQKALLTFWAESISTAADVTGRPLVEYLKEALRGPSPEKLHEQILQFVRRIPSDFFTELNFSGFDASKPLREDLVEQFLALLEKKTTMADLKSSHRFWRA